MRHMATLRNPASWSETTVPLESSGVIVAQLDSYKLIIQVEVKTLLVPMVMTVAITRQGKNRWPSISIAFFRSPAVSGWDWKQILMCFGWFFPLSNQTHQTHWSPNKVWTCVDSHWSVCIMCWLGASRFLVANLGPQGGSILFYVCPCWKVNLLKEFEPYKDSNRTSKLGFWVQKYFLVVHHLPCPRLYLMVHIPAMTLKAIHCHHYMPSGVANQLQVVVCFFLS